MRVLACAAVLLTTSVSGALLPAFKAWPVQFRSLANATSDILGNPCKSTADCPTGTSCVAGSADVAIQSCVANPVCSGNIAGSCPGFLSSGQLVCAFSPVDPSVCSDWDKSCISNGKSAGVYKCMSIDRCDAIPGGVACSAGCKATNGLTCNGRGSCQLGAAATYTCACNAGWSGAKCETVVNGTCLEGIGSCGANGVCTNGACVCNPGFTGAQCEKSTAVTPAPTTVPATTATTGNTTNATTAPTVSTTSTPGGGGTNPAVTSPSTNNDPNKANENGSNHTAVTVIVILVALAAIGAVAYLIVAKKRREKEAAEVAALMDAEEDDGDRVPTPKSAIQVL
ncbi:Aste57867_20277 [Aphanomyces stellatus]|uniref:Aste57867_20277 protein n=1 Tax=Aphanomyces stellatus TaxID=120398 RepID=A0A485LJB2_9STRA|nr:hypothetical protein As57867_020211 [Aphanomyces stellatus]VFT96967.1 Aste57867_20277 [Aphanomyces stellatus]